MPFLRSLSEKRRGLSRFTGLFLIAAGVFTGLGCKLIMMAGYLIGGPPSIEPRFDTETKKSMTDYGVNVAVVVYAPNEIRSMDPKIDKDLAKLLSYKLTAKHIKVVNPDRVNDWLDRHPKYDKVSELGADFKSKMKSKIFYVIEIELDNFNLYEKGSQTLHRGKAEGLVSVWEIDDDGEGTRIFKKELKSKWPLVAPKSTSEMSQPQFRRRYLNRLSEEIGRNFYEHYNGDDLEEVM